MEESQGRLQSLTPALEKVKTWAAAPNPAVNTPSEEGRIAGFWLGLWHGATAPVTLVLALLKKDVHVFDVHNSGNGYLAGFLLGLLTVWGGAGRGARRR